MIDTKKIALGSYTDALQAAIAYDNKYEDEFGFRPNKTEREDEDLTKKLTQFKNNEVRKSLVPPVLEIKDDTYNLHPRKPNKHTGLFGVVAITRNNWTRYRTSIDYQSSRYNLGSYVDPENAAIIYDNAIEGIYGVRPNNTDPKDYDPNSKLVRGHKPIN